MSPSAPTPATLIEQLSPRRREVLTLVAKGLTNDEIARQLGLSPLTVRTHMTALLSALEVTNRTEAAAAFVAWQAGVEHVSRVLRRPAIAVLPFEALDDSPRARRVAVAIAHDLAALFARNVWFPVIANSSAANARAAGGDCTELGRRLGARFIVDGTLRLEGNTLRLAVHIEDAETGLTLWTERREAPFGALFEVQDAICEAIVAAAYPVLVAQVQRARPQVPHPIDLPAWEICHEAMTLYGVREAAPNARAREAFASALEREPTLVLAHYGLGLAAYDELLNQWGPAEAAAERISRCADRCLELAPTAAEGYFLLGRLAQARGDHPGAVGPLETAVAHNPSFAHAHALLSQVLQLAGRSEEALVRMQHAVRLGPTSFVAGLAALHFTRAEYAEALEACERAIATKPRYVFARFVAAASAWFLGDVDRARQHVCALRASNPRFDTAQFLATFGPVDAVARMAQALSVLDAR